MEDCIKYNMDLEESKKQQKATRQSYGEKLAELGKKNKI